MPSSKPLPLTNRLIILIDLLHKTPLILMKSKLAFCDFLIIAMIQAVV